MEHLFDIEIAKKYGVNAAIILRHLQFWIIKNKAHKKHFHDGRTWTYYSVKALTKIFPYLTQKQVRSSLNLLTQKGIILKGNYNQKKNDKTSWYAFLDENRFAPEGKADKSICPVGQMDMPCKANGYAPEGKALPNPSTTDELQINKPNQVLLTSQERLALDLQIAEGMKFFTNQLSKIFRLNKVEARTFAGITKYLVEECQACRLKPAVFKDAVEWARQAKRSNAQNPKGLFVAKIKQETGFKKQVSLLSQENENK